MIKKLKINEAIEHPYEEEAKEFAEAIRKLANDESALDDFESYMSRHLKTWFEKFCTSPEGLISELNWFTK